MNEERLYILRMVEEGKITAEQAAALLEALDEGAPRKEGPGESRAGKEQEGAKSGASTSSDELSAKAQEFAAQVREAVRAALRNVPHVTEEIRENWSEVRHDIQQAIREIKEEMRKGPLVDWSGLAELFRNLRGVTRGMVHESEEVLTGEFAGEVPRVRLRTRNGSISVRGWDERGYKVVLKKRVFVDDETEAEELSRQAIDLASGGDRLEVLVNDSSKLSVSIEAWLPRAQRFSIKAESMNGAVSVEGLKLLEGSLATTNGAVRAREVSAERLELHTVNGSILGGEAVVERLNAVTTNGAIAWSGGAMEAALKSVNGSIRAEAGVPAGLGSGASSRYRIECVNGSVRVSVPEDPSVGVQFEARGRRIDLGDDEEAFRLEEERGGEPGKSRRLAGATPGFESAPKQIFVEASTLNGTVRIALEEPEDEEPEAAREAQEAGRPGEPRDRAGNEGGEPDGERENDPGDRQA